MKVRTFKGLKYFWLPTWTMYWNLAIFLKYWLIFSCWISKKHWILAFLIFNFSFWLYISSPQKRATSPTPPKKDTKIWKCEAKKCKWVRFRRIICVLKVRFRFPARCKVSRSSAVAAALALSSLSPAQFAALFSPVVILQTDEQLVRGTGG